MKTITDLTKPEKNLLLFLECCSVDYAGVYQPARINSEDLEIMDRWRDEGFIDHGRVSSEYLTRSRCVWAKLSPEAEDLAQQVRRERAARMWANREWTTTEEKRLPEAISQPEEQQP